MSIVCCILVIAAVGYYVLSWVVPSWQNVRNLTARRDELEASITSLQTEVAGYKRKQERFATDPAFVERVARENGRSSPDEVVFVFE